MEHNNKLIKEMINFMEKQAIMSVLEEFLQDTYKAINKEMLSDLTSSNLKDDLTLEVFTSIEEFIEKHDIEILFVPKK